LTHPSATQRPAEVEFGVSGPDINVNVSMIRPYQHRRNLSSESDTKM